MNEMIVMSEGVSLGVDAKAAIVPALLTRTEGELRVQSTRGCPQRRWWRKKVHQTKDGLHHSRGKGGGAVFV